MINDHFWKIWELRFRSLELLGEHIRKKHIQSQIIRKS
jgi:hypothetical protein